MDEKDILPIIQANVDISSLSKAICMANELIDKIHEIKKISEDFQHMIENMDINLTLSGKQEGS